MEDMDIKTEAEHMASACALVSAFLDQDSEAWDSLVSEGGLTPDVVFGLVQLAANVVITHGVMSGANPRILIQTMHESYVRISVTGDVRAEVLRALLEDGGGDF